MKILCSESGTILSDYIQKTQQDRHIINHHVAEDLEIKNVNTRPNTFLAIRHNLGVWLGGVQCIHRVDLVALNE